MSDLCCKEVSIRVNPSGFIDCSTEDPLWVSGVTDINNAAYAGSIGYLLTMRLDVSETQTLLAQYNNNNTLTEVASVLQYCRSGVVWHSAEYRFVFASADTIYTFDPVTNLTNIPTLVTDPIGLVTADAIKFVYVPEKSKTYGQFRVGGTWYMGEINLTAGTLIMLGALSTFWSNMTYSPVTDSLYGTTGGNSLKRFDLTGNNETTVAAVAADDCGWDSDADKLICFGSVITEVDTLFATATVRNDHVWAYTTSKHPVYCSSIHKFYVTGDNSTATEKILYSYDTQDYRVQEVERDLGYWGVFPIDDTVMLAAVYDLDDPATDGWRRLCVSGLLRPYRYFKFDEGTIAPTYPGPSYFFTEEVDGDGCLQLVSVITSALTAGIIENSFHQTSSEEISAPWNYSSPPDESVWENIFTGEFTFRMWFRFHTTPASTPFTDWLWETSNVILDYNWVEFGPLVLTLFWTPDDALPPVVVGDSIPVDNNWHRVIFWYKSGVQVGIKIDDNPSVTAVAPAMGTFTGGTTNLSDQRTDIDELAIYKGLVLTEEEMTADWNDGDGTTWPEPEEPE